MADDDPLAVFRAKLHPQSPTASAQHPSEPRAGAEPEDHEAYEPFSNKVRPVCVELRCHRTGLAHFVPYAHLGAITFNFRTGRDLYFTGCGLAVTIRGRNLGEVARALQLHSAHLIQDFDPSAGSRSPADPNAAFVEVIQVEVLGAPRPQARVTREGESLSVPSTREPLVKA